MAAAACEGKVEIDVDDVEDDEVVDVDDVEDRDRGDRGDRDREVLVLVAHTYGLKYNALKKPFPPY